MSFFNDTPRYSALPRVSEDSERPSSDQDPLISRSPVEHDEVNPTLNLSHQTLHIPPPSSHQSYPDFHDRSKGRFAFPLALLVRTLATMLCIATLICFSIELSGNFIAALIFLIIIIIFNFFMAIFPSVLRFFQPTVFAITVEYRGQPLTREVTSARGPIVSVPTIIDLILSLGLFLGVVIGNASMYRWSGGPWHAGVVLGYITIGVQLLAAIPALEQTTISIKMHSNDFYGKFRPDTKLPAQRPAQMTAGTSNDADLEVAEGRATGSEEPRQPVQDLV